MKTDKLPILALVFPCYNEEEILPYSFSVIEPYLLKLKEEGKIHEDSFLLFVDDGSKDATWNLIEAESKKFPHLKGLKLAANAGHQNALLAGMLHVKHLADCLVTMDVDLQDDICAVEVMLEKFMNEGNDIVYGVRTKRDVDSFFKRNSAALFYNCMHWMGVNVIHNHADFRLVSRIALQALEQFEEHSLFLRGIFPTLGFKTTTATYERKERIAGETKYPLRKMIALAVSGITMFSPSPLRLAGIMSCIVMLFAMIHSCVVLWVHSQGIAIPGWSSTMIVMLLLGAIQLFCLAIIGEYIAKIFIEVKRRPKYIIEKSI